ncbi:alpha/beta fold hydrolase [Aliikangiella maris]|uniref:Alpha/beta fold hydrolase n=2 Tax=Aliikangiella maris TaxID=3162458 RepID=A0ABV3MJ02_9GAMM
MKSILVTGATGFIGSHFIVESLLQTDAVIYCLARDTRMAKAADRVSDAIYAAAKNSDYAIEQFTALIAQRVVVLNGDVTCKNLGLDDDFIQKVKLDEIWHCAALLKFNKRLKNVIHHNTVGGAREVVMLARYWPNVTLNYLSTAYVAGNKTGSIPQALSDEAFSPNNAYEEAKREAEKLIVEAHQKYGVNYRIFRPSMVVGHSKTFCGKTDTGFYGLITIATRLGNEVESKLKGYFHRFPIKLLADAAIGVNLIYIDDVINIMRTVAQSDSINQIYHVANTEQVKVDTLLDAISTVTNIPMDICAELKQLGPLDNLVRKQVGDFEQYFKQEYRFEMQAEFATARAISNEDVMGLAQAYYDRFVREDKRSSLFESVLDIMQPKTVEAPEGTLNYYAGGQGDEYVMIINAYGQSLHFWNDVIRTILPFYRVIVWEIRGTSVLVGGMDNVYSIEEHVQDAIQILDNENIATTHALAWCTGPKLATILASRYPERFKSLTFVTPCFKGQKGFEPMDTDYEANMLPLCRAVARVPTAAKSIINSMSSFLADEEHDLDKYEVTDEKSHENITSVLGLIDKNLRPLLFAPFVTEKSILNYSKQLTDFWTLDVSQEINQVNQPVMLLTGSEDNITSPELGVKVGKTYQNIVGFQIDGGSHYIHADQHALVSELVLDFLKKGTQVVPMNERIDITINADSNLNNSVSSNTTAEEFA